MKISELIKLLKQAGCYKTRSGANHDIWYSPITNKQFQVPRHGAKYDTKAIKRTLSLPRWLDTLAHEQGLNYSNILQKALFKELHLSAN